MLPVPKVRLRCRRHTQTQEQQQPQRERRFAATNIAAAARRSRRAESAASASNVAPPLDKQFDTGFRATKARAKMPQTPPVLGERPRRSRVSQPRLAAARRPRPARLPSLAPGPAPRPPRPRQTPIPRAATCSPAAVKSRAGGFADGVAAKQSRAAVQIGGDAARVIQSRAKSRWLLSNGGKAPGGVRCAMSKKALCCCCCCCCCCWGRSPPRRSSRSNVAVA